jgi:hypothetical protein
VKKEMLTTDKKHVLMFGLDDVIVSSQGIEARLMAPVCVIGLQVM